MALWHDSRVIYRFTDHEFDTDTLELRREGRAVRLQRQPALVLATLVEQAGALVPHDLIRQRVWGGETPKAVLTPSKFV
jgi:DNA-binding winged helix-turn-helix (wHTH) protein